MLICYGVGNTASALLSHRTLERLDVVDISREVLSLAPQFARARGSNPLGDPRVHVFVDDGRHHLLVHAQRYDVKELRRRARQHIKDGAVTAGYLLQAQASSTSSVAKAQAFSGERSLTSDAYKIFLAKKYQIEKSSVFDKYH